MKDKGFLPAAAEISGPIPVLSEGRSSASLACGIVTLDPGHDYLLSALDGGEPQRLVFVKREGANYPGNDGAHPGLLTQTVLRALIDRCLYLQNQGSCAETEIIIASLRTALMAFEVRAARCRDAAIDLPRLDKIEGIPTCPKCGHIQCDYSRHHRPHWSQAHPLGERRESPTFAERTAAPRGLDAAGKESSSSIPTSEAGNG